MAESLNSSSVTSPMMIIKKKSLETTRGGGGIPINTPGFLTYTPEKRLTVKTDEGSHGLHPDELWGVTPEKRASQVTWW